MTPALLPGGKVKSGATRRRNKKKKSSTTSQPASQRVDADATTRMHTPDGGVTASSIATIKQNQLASGANTTSN